MVVSFPEEGGVTAGLEAEGAAVELPGAVVVSYRDGHVENSGDPGRGLLAHCRLLK